MLQMKIFLLLWTFWTDLLLFRGRSERINDRNSMDLIIFSLWTDTHKLRRSNFHSRFILLFSNLYNSRLALIYDHRIPNFINILLGIDGCRMNPLHFHKKFPPKNLQTNFHHHLSSAYPNNIVPHTQEHEMKNLKSRKCVHDMCLT